MFLDGKAERRQSFSTYCHARNAHTGLQINPKLGVFRLHDKILTKRYYYLTKVVFFFHRCLYYSLQENRIIAKLPETLSGREPFLPIKIKPVF